MAADERIVKRARRQLICLLVFWIPAITMAQTAPSEAGTSVNAKNVSAAKCSLEGTVIRASDDVPLKKAVITALPQQANPPVRPVSATSDAEGKFLLRDLEPGRYSVLTAVIGLSEAASRYQLASTVRISPAQCLDADT